MSADPALQLVETFDHVLDGARSPKALPTVRQDIMGPSPCAQELGARIGAGDRDRTPVTLKGSGALRSKEASGGKNRERKKEAFKKKNYFPTLTPRLTTLIGAAAHG